MDFVKKQKSVFPVKPFKKVFKFRKKYKNENADLKAFVQGKTDLKK